jgi:hypothetical protein
MRNPRPPATDQVRSDSQAKCNDIAKSVVKRNVGLAAKYETPAMKIFPGKLPDIRGDNKKLSEIPEICHQSVSRSGRKVSGQFCGRSI